MKSCRDETLPEGGQRAARCRIVATTVVDKDLVCINCSSPKTRGAYIKVAVGVIGESAANTTPLSVSAARQDGEAVATSSWLH
jgi:hypothetical protein